MNKEEVYNLTFAPLIKRKLFAFNVAPFCISSSFILDSGLWVSPSGDTLNLKMNGNRVFIEPVYAALNRIQVG